MTKSEKTSTNAFHLYFLVSRVWRTEIGADEYGKREKYSRSLLIYNHSFNCKYDPELREAGKGWVLNPILIQTSRKYFLFKRGLEGGYKEWFTRLSVILQL